MAEKEYKAIIKAIESKTRRTGSHANDMNARAGAKGLFHEISFSQFYQSIKKGESNLTQT